MAGREVYQLRSPRYLEKLRPRPIEQLDAEQKRFYQQLLSGRHGILTAGAASGKTTVLFTFLSHLAKQGVSGQVWALAPSRNRAEYYSQSPLRSDWQQPRFFRTPAAAAFDILRQWTQNRLEPLPSPQLLTGPEEEARLQSLVEQFGADWQWPAEISAELRESPFFWRELRSFMATCAQWGIDEFELADLATYYGQARWLPLSQLLSHYHPTFQTGAWDSACILEQATWCLNASEDEQTELLTPLQLPRIVLLDDLQDCPAGVARFLAALGRRGCQVVVTSNPQISVEGFRGAHAENASYLAELLNDQVASKLEGTELSVPGPEREIYCGTLSSCYTSEVETKVVVSSSAGKAADQIAEYFAQLRLQENVPWSEMAVIARNQGQLEGMRLALEMRGIPLAPARRTIQFNQHPATKPFLEIYWLAGEEKTSTLRARQVEKILAGTWFELDSLTKARLDRVIAQSWPQHTQITDWFYGHFATPDFPILHLSDDLPGQAALNRFARLMQVMRELLADPGSLTPNESLWKLWEISERQSQWEKLLNPTDDDNLDAIIALFKHCQVWSELNPTGTFPQYLEYLSTLNQPQDTLGSQAQRLGGLQLLTATAAGGQRFTATAISGLQEGAWPNTGIRDWILGAGLLHDLKRGRAVTTDNQKLLVDPQARARENLKDEASLLQNALTRAEKYRLISLVDDLETTPSGFGKLMKKQFPTPADITVTNPAADPAGITADTVGETAVESPADASADTAAKTAAALPGKVSTAAAAKTEHQLFEVDSIENDSSRPEKLPTRFNQDSLLAKLPLASNLRDLVTYLRYLAVTWPRNSSEWEQIRDTLVFLAMNGVVEADPATWRQQAVGWEQYATQPQYATQQQQNTDSNSVPLDPVALGLNGDWWTDHSPSIDSDRNVILSPSAIETIYRCPLKWFLERHGGSRPTNASQKLGILVHQIAEEKTDSSLEEKIDFLTAHWPEEKETWLGKRSWLQAVDAVKRLHKYLEGNPYPVLLEKNIKVPIDQGKYLVARLDRLEALTDGVRIIDYKTGKSAPAGQEIEKHEQLLAYQFALETLLADPSLAEGELADFLRQKETEAENLGAALVYVRKEACHRKEQEEGLPAVRRQLPLFQVQIDQEQYRLSQAAEIMKQATYPACLCDGCLHCGLQYVCPLTGKGSQIL